MPTKGTYNIKFPFSNKIGILIVSAVGWKECLYQVIILFCIIIIMNGVVTLENNNILNNTTNGRAWVFQAKEIPFPGGIVRGRCYHQYI